MRRSAVVGTGERQLLPGTYQYYPNKGGERVSSKSCSLFLNDDNDDERSVVRLPYGETFIFTFYTYQGEVELYRTCDGALYRIGD